MERPLRLEWIDPATLEDNPRNWRRHPDAQLSALKDTISEVGWAGALLYNERTERLIDGHGRKKIAAPGEPVPVLIGSWDEATERKILATLDPLAAMAEADSLALKCLLAEVETESDAIQSMLDGLAKDNPLPTPEVHEDEIPQEVETICKRGDLWILGRQVTCPKCKRTTDV